MDTVELRELVEIYLGVTHTPKYVETGIPFLSVKDISSGKISFDNCKYISENEYNSLPNGAKPQIGDMLFCRVGTIGKPIVIERNIPVFGSFVSLGYFRNKDKNKLNLNYLKYWMYSESFSKQVKQNVKGASQINLNTGWLSKFIIGLPDIATQNSRIVLLDKCCNIIETKNKQLLELDNLIKSKLAIQKSIDDMQTLFDSLMQEYFG